jgi:hypothetical protein
MSSLAYMGFPLKFTYICVMFVFRVRTYAFVLRTIAYTIFLFFLMEFSVCWVFFLVVETSWVSVLDFECLQCNRKSYYW